MVKPYCWRQQLHNLLNLEKSAGAYIEPSFSAGIGIYFACPLNRNENTNPATISSICNGVLSTRYASQLWHNYLILLKTHCMRRNPYLRQIGWLNNWYQIAQRLRVKPNTTVLLKGCSSKMISNDIFYGHKSVPCTAVLRETSYSRRKQIQRPTARWSQRLRDLWTLILKCDVSIKSLPLGPREPCWRWDRKSIRDRGDGRHQRNKVF